MNIFFNHDEDRIRAGWRIACQLFLLLLIVGGLTIFTRSFMAVNSFFATFLTAVGAVISIYLAALGLDKRPWSDYGLQFNNQWLLRCGLGFGLAGLAMAVIFIVEYSAGWVTITNYGWQQQVPNTTYVYGFLSFLVSMIMVGFYEEFVFRGYQIVNASEGLNLPGLSPTQAAWVAVALSSLIFGAGHAFNPNAGWFSTLNIAGAGAMLAFPFIITGSLSLSVGLHIGWNFFQGGIFGFPVSGIPIRASLLQITQKGPDLLTGGAFGPEAGLLGLLGMAFITLGLYGYFRRCNQSLSIHEAFANYTPSTRNYPV